MERSLDALLDRASLDRALLDRASLGPASLDRGVTPDGEPTRWQPVAQVLAALTSAPESSELSAEARALAEFRAFAETPARGAGLSSPAPRRGPGRMTWRPGGRLAVAAATGAVLMGGLLAVAYAGDLPAPAQRLAHDTIDAPAARPDRDPAASSQSTGSPNSGQRASQRATPALGGPDRQVHRGSGSGHPHRYGSSSLPSRGSSGRPGYGRLGAGRPGSFRPGSGRQGRSSPGGSAEPWPIQAPWPSASISPPASATPSPTAAPANPGHLTLSRARPALRALPPDHPPPPVAAAGAVRRAGSQPPRGLGPSHTRLVTQISGGSRPRWCLPR
jgi:hypothetical protein